jgi:hypothetical protein
MKILELNVNEESNVVGAERTVAVCINSVVSVEQANSKIIVTCLFGARLTKYTEHFDSWQAAQMRYEELLRAISDKSVVLDKPQVSVDNTPTTDAGMAAALMRCSVEITNSPNIPAQVFCEYSGHVKCLVVNVYIPGWSPNAEPDFHYDSQEGYRFNDVYKDTYTVHEPADMLWILQRMIAGAKDGVEASTEEVVNGDYATMIASDYEDYKSENKPARLYADGDVYVKQPQTVDKEEQK